MKKNTEDPRLNERQELFSQIKNAVSGIVRHDGCATVGLSGISARENNASGSGDKIDLLNIYIDDAGVLRSDVRSGRGLFDGGLSFGRDIGGLRIEDLQKILENLKSIQYVLGDTGNTYNEPMRHENKGIASIKTYLQRYTRPRKNAEAL